MTHSRRAWVLLIGLSFLAIGYLFTLFRFLWPPLTEAELQLVGNWQSFRKWKAADDTLVICRFGADRQLLELAQFDYEGVQPLHRQRFEGWTWRLDRETLLWQGPLYLGSSGLCREVWRFRIDRVSNSEITLTLTECNGVQHSGQTPSRWRRSIGSGPQGLRRCCTGE